MSSDEKIIGAGVMVCTQPQYQEGDAARCDKKLMRGDVLGRKI
jgi:hypothetical protein